MSPPPIRRALITGSSRGIGLAIARILSQNSYQCTLLSRSRASLTSAVESLESSHLPPHQQHAYIAGDVSAPNFWTDEEFGAEWENLRQRDLFADHKSGVDAGELRSSNRKIDVLVNCAGMAQNSLFMRTKPGDIRHLVDMNLTAMMLGTRYLLRKQVIVASKGGKGQEAEEEVFKPAIINVASLLGVKGGRGAVAYAASKAGVLGFTRALALEVGKSGIRVNAIVPGYISTDMTADLKHSPNLLSEIPAGRFGKPEEVADAALFLIRNQYAMNCVLNLDGGLSAT